MNKIKRILGMKHNGVNSRDIANILNVSKTTVNNIYNQFCNSGVSWPLPEGFSMQKLVETIYPPKEQVELPEEPDWKALSLELARPGVTKQLLYEEYSQQHLSPLGRTAFYEKFRAFSKSKKIIMSMQHKAGDKLFVDYSGDGISYLDKKTGEVHKLEVFVAAWGASGYAFADVTQSQNKEDWVESHVRAFEYFKAIPRTIIPDNLKSAVLKPSYYEPQLNPLYDKMAEHYGTVILPARVAKPQDKGLVENAVLQVQRRILAPLRNEVFYSIAEVRKAVLEKLELFNLRAMKDYDGQNRAERFALTDKQYAPALTQERFVITSLKTGVRIQSNYHIKYEKHYYSVPHEYAGQRVDVYQSGSLLEIYLSEQPEVHICRHQKSSIPHGYTTTTEHMPPNHAYVKGLTPAKLILQGGQVGEQTATLVKKILEKSGRPEQLHRFAQGVLSFARKYGEVRLEKACTRALYFGTADYKSVKAILESKLDQKPLDESIADNTNTEKLLHTNLRGSGYYRIDSTGGEYA